MENVPKIVRERLKSAAVVNHPDADALTAFAERSLPEVERVGVLDHLSRCTECREVVALALPAIEPAAVVMPLSPSRLLAWRAFRWGFAAAGLIVIVSLGLLQYQRHRSESMTASQVRQAPVSEGQNEPLTTVPGSGPAKVRDKAQGAAQENSVSAGASAEDKLIADLKSAAEPTAAVAPQASPGGARGYGQVPAHGPRMLNQTQQSANALQAPIAQPSQYANAAPAQVANARAPQVPAQAQSQAIQPAYDYAEAKVEKAKPVEATVSSAAPRAEAAAGAQVSAGSNAPSTASPAAWRITPDGGLQRSLDQGSTWQDVDVRTNGSATAGGNFSVAVQSALDQAKKAAPPATPASAAPVFRAVTANGADVWVGGLAAVLYHSTDAGNHWTRVVPSSGASVLAGDIVSLSFADSQHGTISTATSRWTTSDGGQSWQQQ